MPDIRKLSWILISLSMLFAACSQTTPAAITPSLQTSTQASAPEPTPSDEVVAPEARSFQYQGVDFQYPASIAENAVGAAVPAHIDPSGFVFQDIPNHVRVDFLSPYTYTDPFAALQPDWSPWMSFQNPNEPRIKPQIFVFPVDGYSAMNQQVEERISRLAEILEARSVPTSGELPVLPMFNAAQDLRAQSKLLQFENGSGVRFIARYSQGIAPILNPQIFYTFQGLTDDGRSYIAAFFPIYTSLLPDEENVEDWDAFSRQYRGYKDNIELTLNSATASAFVPDMEILDRIIESLKVEPE